MNTLLHPTDFSINSEQAFLIACGIARDQNALLIVLHVVSPRECAPQDLCGDSLNPTSDLYHSIWNHFEQLRSLAGNVRVSFDVIVGETIDAIMNVVSQEHCDLIILAGRNHQASFYQLHGCISESLIRRRPCSVLLLRHFQADQCQLTAAVADTSVPDEMRNSSCESRIGAIGARCW